MRKLQPGQLDRALRLSTAEGSAWALMVGLAETYFIAIGVHLGASPLELGLLVALPLALGGAGPLTSIRVLTARVPRRSLAVSAVSLQVLTLCTLATLLWLDKAGIPALVALVCLYQMTGQAAGTAWSSWYGDLVPAKSRGRWFSRRNRFVYLFTCGGLMSGGLILQFFAPHGVAEAQSRPAFVVLLALAAAARVVSATLLALAPEPRMRELIAGDQLVRAARTRRGGQALRVLLLAGLFHFSVYWAAPYFAPFMLRDLEFTYVQYMAATLCAIVFKAASSSVWGHWIDGRGARLVYLVSMFAVAVVPIVWLQAHGLALVLAAQAFSGVSWSGFENGQMALLLENSRSKDRPYVFAAQSLTNGWMQLAGVLTAALFILPRVDGYRDIFALSLFGRLIVAMGAPLVIAGLTHGRRPPMVKTPLRVFGLRPHGGFTTRPVLPSEGAED